MIQLLNKMINIKKIYNFMSNNTKKIKIHKNINKIDKTASKFIYCQYVTKLKT